MDNIDWEYVCEEHLPLLEAIRDGSQDDFFATLSAGTLEEKKAGEYAVDLMTTTTGIPPSDFSSCGEGGITAEEGKLLGLTPLGAAVVYGQHELAAYLLADVGVDPNGTMRGGEDWNRCLTPLLLAAAKGDEEMAALVLKHGGDPNIKSSSPSDSSSASCPSPAPASTSTSTSSLGSGSGWTALDLARQNGHDALVSLLEPLTTVVSSSSSHLERSPSPEALPPPTVASSTVTPVASSTPVPSE